MRRKNRTEYFEVWVRSSSRPTIRRGTIVERDFRAEAKIEIAAGAIAEELCEVYGDQQDPSEVARLSREAFLEIDLEHPKLGDEEPL